MALAERIRQARRAKALSQVAFAEKVGVTARAVQLWESGATQPRLQQIRSISEVTGESIDYFMEAVA